MANQQKWIGLMEAVKTCGVTYPALYHAIKEGKLETRSDTRRGREVRLVDEDRVRELWPPSHMITVADLATSGNEARWVAKRGNISRGAYIVARFHKLYQKRGPRQDWPWTGGHTGPGYGSFWDGEHQRPAHRVAYELANNVTVPEDVKVEHNCGIRDCQNPAHLYVRDEDLGRLTKGHPYHD